MSRRPGRATGQFVFHVLNRVVQNTVLFETADDYREWFSIFSKAIESFPIRVLAYNVMPTHWHLVLWPSVDDCLSDFMRQFTGRHADAWRARRGTRGRGAVYQGRFKAIAVQCDGHFLRLCRYVERNALRARLVANAEDWTWSSASPAALPDRPVLWTWPVAKPADWQIQLNTPEPPRSLEEIRAAIRRGRHLGDAGWRLTTAQTLGWRSGRGQGRPQNSNGREGLGEDESLTIPKAN